MPRALLLAILLLSCAGLRAADAPGEAEWGPVAKALAAGGDDAVAAVEAITKAYPAWPDGFRALAQARLRAGDPRGAWSAVRQALSLNPADADAGALGVQALSGQVINRELMSSGKERPWSDVFLLADKFTDATDAGGKVAAQAAVAALKAGDEAALAKYLAAAKARSGGAANPVLDFVAAKQALAGKDFAGAIAALERALATRPDYHDALYELGRVHVVAALADPAQAEAHHAKAEEAFTAAARLDAKDAASRFGLGRVRLETGKRLAAAGSVDASESAFRGALNALDEGLQLAPRDVDGKLWKGDALLRLKRWEEAVPMLQQALAGGATDRALPFNLALALTNSGRSEDAAAVLGEHKAESPEEQLAMAMTAFKQRNYAAASDMLTETLRKLPDDTPDHHGQRLAVLRFYAHAQRLLGAAGGPEQKKTCTDEAIGAYQKAGDLGDFPSRHWYAALNAQRSPEQAFQTGKQLLAWDGWLSREAWPLLIGNYGHHITRGEGISGLIAHGAAHLMLWSLIAMICVMLFLKGLIMPAAKPARPAAKPATASRARPGTRPVGAGAGAGSAARRAPGKAQAPRPPSNGPRPAGTPRTPTPGGPKTPFSE